MGKIITIVMSSLFFSVIALININTLEPETLCHVVSSVADVCKEWDIKSLFILGGLYFAWGVLLSWIVFVFLSKTWLLIKRTYRLVRSRPFK